MHSANTLTPFEKLVFQQESHDCGVACLAMAAGITYDSAKYAFSLVGLDRPSRPGRKPFSSNFKELRKAFELMGYPAEVTRFKGWHAVQGPCVVAVQAKGGAKGDWHWVFADRTEELGVVVLDPAWDCVATEAPVTLEGFVPLEVHQPLRSFLQLNSAAS